MTIDEYIPFDYHPLPRFAEFVRFFGKNVRFTERKSRQNVALGGFIDP